MTDNSEQSNTQSLLYELAESIGSLVIREHQILQDELNQVAALVEDAVQELGGSFRKLNACVKEQDSIIKEISSDNHNSKLNGLSQQVNSYISNMRRALQFDDIVQQLAGHASERIGQMQQLFKALGIDVANLKSIELEKNTQAQTYLMTMLENTNKYRQLLEKENPVKQSSMTVGEIELF